MKIGIAGPVSLNLLAARVNHGERMPPGYLFAPMALWVEGLLARGHQVTLFTLAPGIDVPQTFTGEQLTIHIGRYRSRRRAWDFFRQEQQDLLAAIRQDPVDVLHAHWTYEFALAAIKSSLPLLVTAHDAPLNILKINRDPYRLVRFLMAWQVCSHKPALTAVSPYIERHFRQVFGFKGPIPVIPNGVPALVFELHRSRLERAHKEKIIFASNLTGWAGRKNGQTLVRAFSLVRRQCPESELWMFGNGHGAGEAAQHWAEGAGLAQNIQFRGQMPYTRLMQELAENVDVLVHPALEESFSMAIAEAMALGIPVIGGKFSGAVPYTLGRGGLLVNVKNQSEMANAMLALANDSSLRIKFGSLGSERARTHYQVEGITRQYEDLYASLFSSERIRS